MDANGVVSPHTADELQALQDIERHDEKFSERVEFNGGTSITMRRCRFLKGVSFRGTYTGTILLERCEFFGQFVAGPNLTVEGSFIIRDECQMFRGLSFEHARISGALILEDSRISEAPFRIYKSQLGTLRINAIRHEQWAWEKQDVNDGDYRGLEIRGVSIQADCEIVNLDMSVLSGEFTVRGSLVVRSGSVGRLTLERCFVQERSVLEFDRMPQVLSVINCDLGNSARLRIPKRLVHSSVQIDLEGSIDAFHKLPPAGQLLPLLKSTYALDNRRATLVSLMRAYETAGNTLDALDIREQIAWSDLSQASWWQAPGKLLESVTVGRAAHTRILISWLGVFLIGTFLTCIAEFTGQPDVVPSESKTAAACLSSTRWNRLKRALLAALDGALPIKIINNLKITRISAGIHIIMKVCVWLIIILFMKSLAML